MTTTPWSQVKHKSTRRQQAQARARLEREMAAAAAENASRLGTGSPQTLLAARATQQMARIAREEFDTALLQARRDGWSLRALADVLGLSYTSVKRYSQRAVDRGY